MVSAQDPQAPDVYLSGACISGLTTSVFADPLYHEGLLIGEYNGPDRKGINIYGMLPFRIFGPETDREIESNRKQLDGFKDKIFGVYRCRQKMENYQISLNDFIAINHFKARLFCLIEKSSDTYSMVEQTLFSCTENGERWSIKKIPFGIWSLANLTQTDPTDLRRMHEGPNLELSTAYMATLLDATKQMIDGANKRLNAESQQLVDSVGEWQRAPKPPGSTSLEQYLKDAPGVNFRSRNAPTTAAVSGVTSQSRDRSDRDQGPTYPPQNPLDYGRQNSPN